MRANRSDLPVSASALLLTFGHVPVDVEPGAASLLATLPRSALAKVLAAVRLWIEDHPVRRVEVFSTQESEDSDMALEAVIEIHVDGEMPEVLVWWESLAAVIDRDKRVLRLTDRLLLDRYLGVHLVWEEEP